MERSVKPRRWAARAPGFDENAQVAYGSIRDERDEIEGRARRLLAELAIPYRASPHKAEQ
jgi:hypothetical protein